MRFLIRTGDPILANAIRPCLIRNCDTLPDFVGCRLHALRDQNVSEIIHCVGAIGMAVNVQELRCHELRRGMTTWGLLISFYRFCQSQTKSYQAGFPIFLCFNGVHHGDYQLHVRLSIKISPTSIPTPTLSIRQSLLRICSTVALPSRQSRTFPTINSPRFLPACASLVF